MLSGCLSSTNWLIFQDSGQPPFNLPKGTEIRRPAEEEVWKTTFPAKLVPDGEFQRLLKIEEKAAIAGIR